MNIIQILFFCVFLSQISQTASASVNEETHSNPGNPSMIFESQEISVEVSADQTSQNDRLSAIPRRLEEDSEKTIAIIGAGVIGLSTGVELLKQGFKVTIFTKETSPNTTSDVAIAVWMPYKVEPKKKAVAWAALSLQRFRELSDEVPEAGVVFKTHTELHKTFEPKPEWTNYLESLPIPSYVPEIYRDFSYTVKIPVIDSTKYMPYLHKLFLSQGGQIRLIHLANVEDLLEQYPLVINCAGVGAKDLVKDDSVYPMRGQVISIQKPIGFDDSMIRPDDALAHIVSRSDDCLIGGTVEEHNWNMQPDPKVTEEIFSRVKEIYPPLADQPITVLREMVGLRPGRSTVRLEMQTFGDSKHLVIHNYGHGGAGFALSWGCASEVVKLVLAVEVGQSREVDSEFVVSSAS